MKKCPEDDDEPAPAPDTGCLYDTPTLEQQDAEDDTDLEGEPCLN